MKSFTKFLESKLLLEADPPGGPPPGGPPPGGPPPGGPPPGGPPPGGPPPGGISAPASLGGGLPSTPPGGPMGGTPGGDSQSGSLKLKAYNVWDVLEKILK